MRIGIKKGLDIPIGGKPQARIETAAEVASVAVLGTDFHGLQPGMAVEVGDRVRTGQTLFVDKKNLGVRFTSPGAGRVAAVNRGERRALQSVVVELEEGGGEEAFASFPAGRLRGLEAEAVRDNLLASGLWTAFRARPFSRIPSPEQTPAAMFVTAIDTNPLAPDPALIVGESAEAFGRGLEIVARLTPGAVYVCTSPDSGISCPETEPFRHAEFEGPHPAGLAGTHIHFLEPVGRRKTVWHIGYQDVIAIGELFTTGRLPTRRVVALGGPRALNPRLLRTRVGASVAELVRGETGPGRLRVVSGSVLSGHRAAGPLAWLGRYHNQITVLEEGSEREFLAWIRPGTDKYSAARAYAGHLVHRGGFDLTTTQNGSPRAMVSIGSFERVMPLDILATPLLKALLVEDTDRAQALGCLELDEEDLALCSFVCNGKYEYGPFLRMNLEEIEAHG